jgi:hypothetical protein
LLLSSEPELEAECHESRSWQSLILLGSGFSIGRVSDLGRRNQASLGSGFGRQALARAEPEDAVPAATLRSASEEIGQELAARVLRQFRARRR